MSSPRRLVSISEACGLLAVTRCQRALRNIFPFRNKGKPRIKLGKLTGLTTFYFKVPYFRKKHFLFDLGIFLAFI